MTKNHFQNFIFDTKNQPQFTKCGDFGCEGNVLQQIPKRFDRRENPPFAVRKFVYA